MRTLYPLLHRFVCATPMVAIIACGNEIGTTDVNGNPTAEIKWPSTRVGDDGEVVLEGLVDHTVRSPADLRVRWLIDGELVCDEESTATPTATGQTLCPAFINPQTDAVIELQAEYNGVIARDVVQIIGRSSPLKEVGSGPFIVDTNEPPNQPPTCQIISPTIGQVIESGEFLLLLASGFDQDQDSSTLSASWTSDLDGLIASNLNTDVLLSLGDHQISLTLTDDEGEQCTAATHVSVVSPPNHPPLATNVQISSPAYTDGVLTCQYTYLDVDGQPEGPTSIEWTVTTPGGSTGNFSGQQLSGVHFEKNDMVTCTVTPHDGIDAGSPSLASVSIENSPPSLGNTGYASITDVGGGLPDPTVDRPLLCSYGTFADADSVDTDQTIISWRVNQGPTAAYGDTFLPSIHGPVGVGDTITCEATPFDGTTIGPSLQDSVTVGYAAPTVSDVDVSPTDPTVLSTLDCSYTYADADMDPSLSTYIWQNGLHSNIGAAGRPLSNTSGTNDNFMKGDTVRCSVTAKDANDIGNTESSAWVTVVNIAPEMTQVDIQVHTPAYPNTTAPTADDLLSCTFNSLDHDVNDSVSYTAQWFVNGNSVQTTSGLNQPDLLDTTPYKGGDEIKCRVVPTDGDDDGQSMEASVILNSPPGYCAEISDPVSGVGFQLGDDYECGQYINGDWWVRTDGNGEVHLVGTYPPVDSVDDNGYKTINGWMVNPIIDGDNSDQAFDERASNYDGSLQPSLPYIASADESLLKARSLVELDNSCSYECLQSVSVLTVVGQPPANDSFRPPYVATSGQKPTYSRADFDTSILPALDISALPNQIPSDYEFATIASDFRPAQITFSRHRNTLPVSNLPYTWDAGYLLHVGRTALALLLDPSAQPLEYEDAFISFTQASIDNYHSMAEGQGDWSKIYAVWFTALYTGHVATPPSSWPSSRSYTERRIVPAANTQVGHPLFGDEAELKGGTHVLANGAVVDRDEYYYWRSISLEQSWDYFPDPYGFIDGGPSPRKGYVGNLSKSAALLLQLGGAPFSDAWGSSATEVMHFAEIHVEEGIKSGYDPSTQVSTDPCAPAPYDELKTDGSHAAEWLGFDAEYGISFGPDGAGGCIPASPIQFNRFLNGQPEVDEDSSSSSLDRDLWSVYYTLQHL